MDNLDGPVQPKHDLYRHPSTINTLQQQPSYYYSLNQEHGCPSTQTSFLRLTIRNGVLYCAIE